MIRTIDDVLGEIVCEKYFLLTVRVQQQPELDFV